jgi:hypothetical protein
MAIETAPPEYDLWIPAPEEGETWDPHTTHTHYFSFSIPDAKIGSFIYASYKPGTHSMHGGIFIWQGHDNNEPMEMDHHDYQIQMGWPTIEGNTVTIENGMRFEFLTPGEEVRVTYSSKDGATTLDCVQRAVTPYIARAHIVPHEALLSGHTTPPGGCEQIMHCVGELVLNGERHDIDCYAFRDRSWGQLRIEEQRPSPPLSCTPMYFGEDLALNQVSYEPLHSNPMYKGLYDVDPECPIHMVGWAVVSGELMPITRVDRNVLDYHPQLLMAMKQTVEIEVETGQVFHFTGESICETAVDSWPNCTLRSGVHRWEDEQGRVTYDTYQEQYFDAHYQQHARRRRLAQQSIRA